MSSGKVRVFKSKSRMETLLGREIGLVVIGSCVCESEGVTGGDDSVSLGSFVGESSREIGLQSTMDFEPSTWDDITTAGGVVIGSCVCESEGVTGGGDSVSLGSLVGESSREIGLQSAMDFEPSMWDDITTAGGVVTLTVFDMKA